MNSPTKIYVAINYYSPERSLGKGDHESKAFKTRWEAEDYCRKRHTELCSQLYHSVWSVLETSLEEESK